MRLGSDAAHTLLEALDIQFFVESIPDDDEELEALSEKVDNVIGEIEELIRLYVILPNEIGIVTKQGSAAK